MMRSHWESYGRPLERIWREEDLLHFTSSWIEQETWIEEGNGNRERGENRKMGIEKGTGNRDSGRSRIKGQRR